MNGRLSSSKPPIYIISGGVGASGEQLVQTVLAQFPSSQVEVIIIPNVRAIEQIERAIQRARKDNGLIAHTLVDSHLRAGLVESAQRHGVVEVDLMGDLLDRLTTLLGEQPVVEPGLYRKLNERYFERITAIEYTLAHDDGKDPEGWRQADIVILGVSRTGKTPLSLYLSVLGWRVANCPLVPGLSPPKELDALDHRRVIGLDIDAGQLTQHRQRRQIRLGVLGPTEYTDPMAIYDELEEARRFYQRKGFVRINITDKPIESCADEIIRLLAKVQNNPRVNSPEEL